jgi:hypothetical protein
MAHVAIGATIASTVLSVAASQQAAENAKRAAHAESLRAAAAAKAAAAKASVEVEQLSKSTELRLSRLRAAAAAQGVEVPEDMFAEVLNYGSEQSDLIRWGGSEQAAGLQDRAAVGEWSAKARADAERTNQIGTVLGGAAQAYGLYDKYYDPTTGARR